ncbi:hypothetical protein V6N11_053149 [Hibiscus sabdariffa]|uniref:Uncharacterized protein n=1 Tax=Hibiscus sabdariffa TaxID=183260 RepID=A0ABR2UCT6_9ROSI
MTSLHPQQTPEATIAVRSSTRDRILNSSSIGISFHSVSMITAPAILTPTPLLPAATTVSFSQLFTSHLCFGYLPTPAFTQTYMIPVSL